MAVDTNLLTTDFATYIETVKLLMLYIVGITIYSLFVFKFYHFLAQRDIVKLQTDRYVYGDSVVVRKASRFFVNTIQNIILTPLCIFFWCAILTFLLAVLSKNHSAESLLLVSVALIGAVRMSAYYDEDLSKDLAKMIPFALLGVFLIDLSFFSIEETITIMKQLPMVLDLLLYYLLLVIFVEIILRIISNAREAIRAQ